MTPAEVPGQPDSHVGIGVSRPALGWREWVPSATMMLCGVLAYIDRQTLAVLAPTILQDTGLTAEAYGKALSAFSFAYMIGNPLWGSFLDFVGLRVGMLLAVTVWTLASTSHAWVGGLLGFIVARSVLGFGEGAAFPGGLRTSVESLPANRQGRGMALCYSGASLGSLITPFIVVPIALHFGWRAAFLITGALGAAWLGLWWTVARPHWLHRQSGTSITFRWPNLLERRSWVVASSFGLGAIALGVVAYLSPLYLNLALGLDQAQVGKVIWIPSVGWEIGYFFWGWVADRWGTERDQVARVLLLLAFLALPLAAVTRVDSVGAALALFCWAMFVADGFVVMSLRVGARIYPVDSTGMAAGIGVGSWSAVLTALLPLWGRWFDRGWYEATFVMVGVMPMLGTALWLWLTHTPGLWTQTEGHG